MSATTIFFDTLRSNVQIFDVVSKRVVLKKRNKEYVGLCPFHSEKSPSFTVSNIKRFYHCFGCGAHGDVIKFVSEVTGLKYMDAATKLAEEHGIKIPRISRAEEMFYEEVDQIHDVLKLAVDFFRSNMNDEAKKYLFSRKLNNELIDRYEIGFASFGDALQRYLTSKNIHHAILAKTGLLGKNDDGGIYEIFRNRIIFPIKNQYGKIIGFGGRAVGQNLPKYLNSPETILFKKNEAFYGEDKAIASAYRNNAMIVVEGYLDVIAMQSNGFENTVATMGTACTVNHIEKLWRIVGEIIMCLDGDQAGIKGASKAVEHAISKISCERTISFALLPTGHDPDSILSDHGKSFMSDAIARKIGMAEMIWNLEIYGKNFTTPESKGALENRLQEYVDLITDPTLKRNYSKFFREKCWGYFLSKKSKNQNNSLPQVCGIMTEVEMIEYGVLRMLTKCPWLLYNEKILEEVCEIKFTNNDVQQICDILLEMQATHDAINTEQIMDIMKSSGLYDVFMLASRLDFGFGSDSELGIHESEVVWSILMKKRCLVENKTEYARLITSADPAAFDIAKEYIKEISRLQREIDIVSDKLIQN